MRGLFGFILGVIVTIAGAYLYELFDRPRRQRPVGDRDRADGQLERRHRRLARIFDQRAEHYERSAKQIEAAHWLMRAD